MAPFAADRRRRPGPDPAAIYAGPALARPLRRHVRMCAAIQIRAKRPVPSGQGLQFLADFTRFDAPRNVIQQLRARGESPALQIAREQPVTQIGFGAFHHTQIQDVALLVAQ